MKNLKIIISLLFGLLFCAACGSEFSTRSISGDYFLLYPATRVVIINQSSIPVRVFNDRGEFLGEIPGKNFRTIDIHYCWENEYVFILKSSTATRYYRIWCNTSSYYYPRKEVIEVY